MRKPNKNIQLIPLFRFFLYVLPLLLYFSYFPVISLGANETMNFELSLPLLWLVLFDILGFLLVCLKYRKKLFTKIFGSFWWWLFPFFATFSIAWSLNPLRGILTVGVMWLLVFAVVFFWELRENLDASFWKIFWRWFFGSAVFACGWCVVQCILDIVGVPQEASLLCDGCVYSMFGFPHPNGFAIEPQFMGNLLLAPIFVSIYFYIKNHYKKYLLLFFVFLAILFLTFSRGAIYACVAGLVFFDFFVWVRAKKSDKKAVCKNIMKTVGVFAIAFLFTLNLQGIFTALSPTSDTYADGVAKVLNHLSLGVIDIRDKNVNVPVENSNGDTPVKPVENSGSGTEVEFAVDNSKNTEAVFDGYVAESTDTRLRLSKAAFGVWHKDFKTIMVGVGLGGAGQALYNNGLSPAPKEIVQNEYMEILLETGLVGFLLFLAIIVLAVRVILKNPQFCGLLLSLMIAYGVTLFFFSGLPNAMQIILIPGVLMGVSRNVR